MEELFADLGFNLFITGIMLGIFVIFSIANTILGCIKNIGIMKEKLKWPLLRSTFLKMIGVVVAGLAGAIALTILPNALKMTGGAIGMNAELETLATSTQTIGTLGLIVYLGKACFQYGKKFLEGFGELIGSDSDGNGIPDGMSL